MAVEQLTYFVVDPVRGTTGGNLIQRDYSALGDNLRFRLFRDYGIRVMEISGLYDIPVRYTDRPRFGSHGSFPSPQYVGSKDITINMRITAGQPEQNFQGIPTGVKRTYRENLERARNIFQPQTTDMGSFLSWFEKDISDTVLRQRILYCRVIDRSEKQTVRSGTASYTDMVVRFRAEDPFIYSFRNLTSPLSVFSATGGLEFPSTGTYPNLTLNGLDFASTGQSPSLSFQGLDFPAPTPSPTAPGPTTTLNNAGNSNAFLSFTLTAGSVPLRVVEINNLTTGVTAVFAAQDITPGDDFSTYPVALQANSTMIVDMNPNTRSVTVDGANRFDLWRRPQIPMALHPGDNNLKYIPDEPDGGNMTLNYRHTWL